MKSYRKPAGLAALLLCLAIIAGIMLTRRPQAEEMNYTDFLHQIEEHNISGVEIQPDGRTFYTWTTSSDTIRYMVTHPRTDTFTEDLLLHNIEISYGSDAALPGAAQLLLLLAAAGAVIWIMIRRKTGASGKLRLQDAASDNASAYHLEDVAGNTEAKHMVDDVISFIRNPGKYTALGARMPRGLLFYGPPGTGKTLMAKAIAGEAGVPFYAMSGSDFVQTYVGVGASRVRDLFGKARKSEKAVIFIDEIDAIGKKRSPNLSASNDERDQTLNALLTEMSGFYDGEGIVVIAATNRADMLDEALLRPGRFDRQIEIGLPDCPARTSILSLHLKDKPLSDCVNMADLAKTTVGFSGAQLENLVNEAAIFAANENRPAIEQPHIDQAFYTVIAGAPRHDRSVFTAADMNLTAYHEAGHALMTKLLLKEHTVSRVTIIPSTRGAGGFSMSIPKESQYMRKSEIEAHIQVLLAGRAAEELQFGRDQITTGAGNDIEKATKYVQEYLFRYGMDDTYGIYCKDASALSSADDERLVRERLNDFYEQAKALLVTHQDLLDAVADALLEKETLGEQELEEVIKRFL